jgi:hypothetical protein
MDICPVYYDEDVIIMDLIQYKYHLNTLGIAMCLYVI